MCVLCEVNTYCPNSANAGVDCPTNSVSPMGSVVKEDCVCAIGYSGNNGGPCAACSAGFFKILPGADCTLCPDGSVSVTGSGSCARCPTNMTTDVDDVSMCSCNKGHFSIHGGCQACTVGAYKDVVGNSTCISNYTKTPETNTTAPETNTTTPETNTATPEPTTTAPETNTTTPEPTTTAPETNTTTPEPTTMPEPNTTTTPTIDPPKTEIQSNLTFKVTLAISATDFTPDKRIKYISSVTSALNIPGAVVRITSVTEQQRARRRLLATETVVETSVTVPIEKVAVVVQSTSYEVLSSYLQTNELTITEVSRAAEVLTPDAFESIQSSLDYSRIKSVDTSSGNVVIEYFLESEVQYPSTSEPTPPTTTAVPDTTTPTPNTDDVDTSVVTIAIIIGLSCLGVVVCYAVNRVIVHACHRRRRRNHHRRVGMDSQHFQSHTTATVDGWSLLNARFASAAQSTVPTLHPKLSTENTDDALSMQLPSSTGPRSSALHTQPTSQYVQMQTTEFMKYLSVAYTTNEPVCPTANI